MKYASLKKSFFNRSPIEVGPDLLGKLLVRRVGRGFVVGRIVEVEAYLAVGDAAAHGYKGQRARNASLYKEAGHAYVHSMRQYFLLDVVTEGEGTPSSVLIRGVEPVQGIELPTNGPGKVGAAFRITRALDGVDMTSKQSDLFIAENTEGAAHEVLVSPRIGISTAKDMPLRFYIKENKHVSGSRVR